MGIPVCWLLTILRRMVDFVRSPARITEPVKKILFIKLAEQGSTVLAYDAFRTAVQNVGRENVYLLVFAENRFIIDLLEVIPSENVLTVATTSAFQMLASACQRLSQIRRIQIDACIDLEFFARLSTAFAFLTGVKRRVGYHTYFGEGPYRGDLLTHRLLYNSHLHTSTAFSILAHALDADPAQFPTFAPALSPPPSVLRPPSSVPGSKPSAFSPQPSSFCPPPPVFHPSSSEIQEVVELLTSVGAIPGERLILFNANAGDLLPLRRWDGQNYVALAKRFLEKFPAVRTIFTGSPSEHSAIANLVQDVDSPRCLCLAGRTTLRQLLVLYTLAEILITNDSGPAHFAVLTPIDVVTLFGPETPLLFAPLGPRSHTIYAGVACSPCVNAYNNRQTACQNNLCMQAITVDQVYETASRIYLNRTED
jgi:ADP-heptose:LPS heptosyltransferase